jgi:predicted phage terminase large subunit-like protein
MPRRPSIHSADVIPDRSKEVIRPNEGPQTAFLSTVADVALFGGGMGGGKTFGLLLEAMRHSQNPDYRATIFRRTLKQIQKQGSLWDSAEELYPKVGARPNLNSLTWKWPSGAEVQMAGLEFEKSVDNYLGAQIDMMGFDEATTFSRRQVLWLISRNRGRAGILPYIRMTCNPDADSWVAKWVEWYVDQETGYPIKARSGKLRWFAVINDKVHWASSRQQLIDEHGADTLPMSFTFIPSLVGDNPPLLEKNPGYRAKLRAMSAVDNLRNEKGNWKVRAEAGKVFSRFWFKECPTPTGPGAVDCRFFDLAGTEKKTKGDDPDFTAGTLTRKVGARYHVLDCVAAQDAPADVEELMTTVARQDALRAQRDDARYMLRWETEPGSASIRENARLVAKFAGIDARGVTPREHGAVSGKWDKIARAGPLAAQARAGNVFVCPDTWPEREESMTIDDFLAEMHGFPDRPHDDVPDSASGSCNCLPSILSDPTGDDFTVGESVMPQAWNFW